MTASSEITDMGTRPSVERVGFKAHRCMTAPGFSGSVIAAGSRAVYISTDDGDLLAACSMDQQPHPRSFLTDLDLSSLHEGIRTWYEGDELRFGNGASLMVSENQVWYRPSAVPPCVAPVATTSCRPPKTLMKARIWGWPYHRSPLETVHRHLPAPTRTFHR